MLDSRLKFIRENADDPDTLELMEASPRFALERETANAEPTLRVLVQVDPTVSTEQLEAAGLVVTTRAGDVVAGDIALSQVERLDALEGVVLIESARAMIAELDLSVPEIGAATVHTGPPGLRGAGVIVGIIDSGIDWRHETFRDPLNQTRILRIWDQNLIPQVGESSPAPFGYGVEYDSARINVALSAPNPLSVVRHMDDNIGHGTHVAGIAAGDGSPAGNGRPPSTFVGVAPEADIVLVSNRVTTEAMGDSASTLDAVRYIFDVAQTLGRPCVINLSQGDNLGPHDGTSLLERGIDNLLGPAGRSMVKSAGNAANAGVHASGTIAPGGSASVSLLVPANDTSSDTIDFWYGASDRISVRIASPGGVASAVVAAGTTTTLTLANGNRVFVDSVLNHPNNGDNRIYLQLQRGTAATVEQGTWTVTLSGVTITLGTWNGWVERGDRVPQLLPPFRNEAITISVPGTSREVITAGSYITRGPGLGNLSTFSSRGPTRDGRPAPTLSAPGQVITSALVGASGTNQWTTMSGTSMAAPHLTGVVALMLQAAPTMTQTQIINCLTGTARTDSFTGATPNTDWGAGKVDAVRAVACASSTATTTFTRFTGFTLFTPFTLFSRFTRFTPFTLFTPFTRFTPFTLFSRFTRFTRFTIGPIGPDPFIRFRNVLLDPADLALQNFQEFAPYAEALGQYGVTRLDQLASLDLSNASEGEGSGDLSALVARAQDLLRGFTS
jgi:subtilisin family serine protease